MSFLQNLLKFFKKKQPPPEPSTKPLRSPTIITSKDIKAIAGDNVMATQLDLARAYLEMDKKKLSKQILEHVIKHGDTAQQQEAHRLIAELT